jgi:hypothetical protein
MKLTYLLLFLLVALPVVTALDITALAKSSGTIRLNRPTQTKVETALGIDFSSMTGVQSNSVTVTLNNVLQIGNIYIIIASINERTYTIIVPAYKLAEYIK